MFFLFKKRAVLWLSLLIWLTACQKEFYSTNLSFSTHSKVAEVVLTKGPIADYSVSKGMVESFINSSPKHRAIVSIEGYPSEESPSMYVVNFDEGWAIYPADSRFGMTLAASPYEHLDLEDKSHNLGFQLMIESYHEQIEHYQGIPMDDYDKSSAHYWDLFREKQEESNRMLLEARNENTSRDGMLWVIVEAGTSTSDSIMVERWHLVGDEWGQEYPWNVKMPLIGNQHCVTGCAPLAVAQVLHFFNVWSTNPSGLYHSISESSRTYTSDGLSITLSRNDYTANSSRWSQMPYSVPYGDSTGFEYASDLILDVGVRLGTLYGLSSSGVSVNTSTNYFDLSPVNLSFSWGMYSYQLADSVMTNIQNRKPVIMTAAKSSNSYSRHTWIIDGVYSYRTFFQNDYELWPVSMIPEGATIVDLMPESQLAIQYPNYYPGMVFHERDGYYDNVNYFMNFGWDGQHKWDYYAVWPNSSWEGYSIIKAVHYNLSPGDLLIQ